MTLDELMEKMAGQRKTNATEVTQSAYAADRAYKELRQKQQEQQRQEHQEKLNRQLANYGMRNANDQVAAKQAAQEKAMQSFAQEQTRKAQQESAYKKNGTAFDPIRYESGKNVISGITGYNDENSIRSLNTDQSNSQDLKSSETIMNDVYALGYVNEVAKRKADGKTDKEILNEIGDYTAFKERQENPISPVTSNNFVARLRNKENAVSDYAGAAIDGFSSGFVDSFMSDLFTGLTDAMIKAKENKAKEDSGLDVHLPRTKISQSMGNIAPLTYDEVMEAAGTPAGRAILEAEGWISEDGTPTEKLNNLEHEVGWNAAGSIVGEIAEGAVMGNVVGTNSLDNNISNAVIKKLSDATGGKVNSKVISYVGKAVGSAVENTVTELPSSIGNAYAESESTEDAVKQIAWNLVGNVASGMLSPVFEIGINKIGSSIATKKAVKTATNELMAKAADSGSELTKRAAKQAASDMVKSTKPNTSVLQEAFNSANGLSTKKSVSLLDAMADIKTDDGLAFEKMMDAVDKVDDFSDAFDDNLKNLYRQSAKEQIKKAGGLLLNFDDTQKKLLLQNIDLNARASAGRQAMVDAINNSVRKEYGDAVADKVMEEMAVALTSDKGFFQYVNELYLTDGFQPSNSSLKGFDFDNATERDVARMNNWLKTLEKSRWVSSEEIDSSKGFSNYIDKKLRDVLKNSESAACRMAGEASDSVSRIKVMDAVATAAAEADAVPKGVGAAERGFSGSINEDEADSLRGAEDAISEVGKKIGDDKVITNLSRATTDAPLDAKITIGDGSDGLKREITGREYIDLIRSSGVLPTNMEEIESYSRKLQIEYSHAVVTNDIESQTRLLLEKQAVDEIKLQVEYQSYLKENGNLSSFVARMVRQESVQSDDGLFNVVSGLESTYLPHTNANVINDARKTLSQPGGEKAALERIFDTKLALTESDVAAASLMYRKYISEEDYENAQRIMDAMDVRGREAGRAIQMQRVFSDTPYSYVKRTKKLYDNAIGEKGTKALDLLSQKAHRADNAAVRQAAENAAKELDDEAAKSPDIIRDAADRVIKKLQQKAKSLNNSNEALLRRMERAAEAIRNPSTASADDIATVKMVNELAAIGKKSIPEIAKKANTMDRWEFAKYAVEHRSEMRSVWNEAQNLAKTKYANDPEMLSILATWTQQNLTDQLLLDQTVAPLLQDAMKKQGFRIGDFADAGIRGNKIGVFAEGMVNQLGLSGEDAKQVYQYLVAELQNEVAEYVSKTASKESLIPSMIQKVQRTINQAGDNPQRIDTVTESVINDIFSIARRIEGKEVVKDATDTMSKITALGDMVNNQKGYSNTWRKVYDQLIEQYKDSPEQLRALKSYFAQDIENLLPEKTVSQAISQGMKAKGLTFQKLSTDYYSGSQKDDLVEYIVKNSGATGKNAESLRQLLREKIYTGAEEKRVAAMKRLFQTDSDAAEAKKAARQFNMLHRDQKKAQKIVYQLLSGGTEAEYREAFCKSLGLPTMTDDKAKKLIWMAQEVKLKEPGSLEETFAYNKLFDEMTRGIPMKKKFAVSALLKTGMLTKPTTHIRNMVGNALNYVTMQSDNAAAAGLEKILVKFGLMDDADRTFSVAWRNGLDGKARTASIGEWWKKRAVPEYSRTGKYSDPRYMAEHRYDQLFQGKNIVSKAANKYSATVSNLLEKEDILAAKFVYFQRAGSMMKAKGLTEMTPEVHEEAMKAAKYYTFHTKAKLSDVLNGVKKLPLAGDIIDLGVMPFTGTTLSVLDQAVIDNNPVQIAIGLSRVFRQNGGDIHDAILKTAKGLTGLGASVLAGIGFYTGLLSITENSTLIKSTGKKEYALNIGPVSVDFSDLSPVTITMFQTVSALQQIHQNSQAGDENASILDGVLQAYFAPAIDASPWGSFKDAFLDYNGELSVDHTIKQIPSNIMGSILPNAVAGVANALDNTSRYTYTDDPLLGSGSKILNDIPGYSFTQSAIIDMWGNEAYQGGTNGAGGNILNILNNTVNPMKASFNRYEDDALTQEVIRLYSQRYANAVPSSPDKDITINGKKYTMTNSEYADMCREIGQLRYTRAKNTMSSSVYQTADDEVKADMLAKRYSEAADDVRKRWKAKLARDLDPE